MLQAMDFDLHIHSKYSFDSVLEIKKILETARKRNLAGIAITDHNRLQGSIEASKICPVDLFIICGSEIETEYGEILGLFLKEEIKPGLFLDVIDKIKEQGGLAVLPHPFKRKKKIEQDVIKNIDAIEGFNGRSSRKLNIQAKKLAIENKLPIIAGSDAHFTFEIGRVRTIIKEDIRDIEDIKKAIKGGKVSVAGVESSEYLECFSQIIKAFKTRKFNMLLPIIRKALWLTANNVYSKIKR
jgi:hypothetical protein